MRLVNHTNISDKKIREIIKFVRPNGISNFDVRISNSKSLFAGRAYHNGSSYHDRWTTQFIVVRITKDESSFPYKVSHSKGERKVIHFDGQKQWTTYKKITSKGYLNYLLLSREEALVSVIAHELRHIWQSKIKNGHRVWGARGQYSERDADAYAIRMTRAWRHKI